MTTNTAETVIMDIEAAITGLESVLPTVLGVVGAFYAPAKAIIPFLPFLQVAMTTLQQVDQVLNQGAQAAVTSVTTALQSVPSAPPQPAS